MIDRFAHQLRVDQLRDGERLHLVADEAELSAIRQRLGLQSLDRCEAHVTLTRNGPLIRTEGRIVASVAQNCVVTGVPIAAHVDEPFVFLFVPAPLSSSGNEETELGSNACDTVFYDGSAIDLGSAVADTLSLSLDLYPRSAGAEAALKEAGVLTSEQASPFALLSRLKRSQNGQV